VVHSAVVARRVLSLVAAGALALAGCVATAPPPAPPLTNDASTPIAIQGVDLHDGMVAHYGSDYYLYGTQYGCGFVWGADTPWCGFGVSSAPSLNGPWSAPTPLFDPSPWQATCRIYGCFNPRMVRRTFGLADGAFQLWFNAPGDYARADENAYYVLSCAGPTGPCGAPHKPVLFICGGANGDFSVVVTGPSAFLVCTLPTQTLDEEVLTGYGTDGTDVGQASLSADPPVEGAGGYHDLLGAWVLTFSSPNCGYCSGGVATGYSTSGSPDGGWVYRGQLSSRSCFGQPRTVDVIDGHPYQQIDQWYGSANETLANTVLAPLDSVSCPPGVSAAAEQPSPGVHPFGNLYTP
jgi:hypothetical protein